MTTALNGPSLAARFAFGRVAPALLALVVCTGCSDIGSQSEVGAAGSAPVGETEAALSDPLLAAPIDEESGTVDDGATAEVDAAAAEVLVDAEEAAATLDGQQFPDADPVPVQANWPSDIPLPKWLVGERAINVGDGVSLRATGEADYLQNVSFFRDELVAAGWTLVTEEQPTPVMDSLTFAKDNRLISLVVVSVVGGISVQLSQQPLPADQT